MKHTYSGIEFRAAVEELIGKINASLNLRPINIKWTQAVPTAAINDMGHILLSDVQDDTRVPHATLLRYVGMGAHELCHHAYTDWSAVELARATTLLAHLHNAVEDAYIERKAIRSGLTGNIESLFSGLIDGMVTEALTEVKDWSDPAQYPFTLAVYLRDHASIKVPVAPGLESVYAGAAERFKSCNSSADALAIAQWFEAQLKALPKAPKPKPKKPSKPNAPEAGKGQEGPQNGSGEAAEGEPKPTPTPSPARAPTGREQFRPVEPAVKSPSDEGEGGGGGSYCEVDSLRPFNSGVPQFAVERLTVPGALRYNLKRLFDNSSRTEFGLRRATGSVDASALSRLGTTDKLFKRRTEIEGIDSAVVLVVDISGSMKLGNRIKAAAECCAALLDTLDKAQVKTCVVTFNHYTSVLKGFGERKQLAFDRLNRLDERGTTNDFFAVRYAHKLLSQRREARKVCLVMTDGNGDIEATKRQVLAGERMGVTTIGVGIQLDVSGVYAQHVNVSNMADLASASFKQIKLAV